MSNGCVPWLMRIVIICMMALGLFFCLRWLDASFQAYGYGFLAMTAIATVADSLFGILLSRTSGLAQLTIFGVDDYQNICDNACDFQRRMLWIWLLEKVAQIITAFFATLVINLDTHGKACLIMGGMSLGFSAQVFLLIYTVRTYLFRTEEIWKLCKTAKYRENEKRVDEWRAQMRKFSIK